MLASLRYAIGLLGLGVVIGAFSASAWSENHVISRSTTKFDGSRVRPGDTVTLQAGTRDALTVTDLIGTKDYPIRVRNDVKANGPVILRRASPSKSGFVFACNTCKHVVIDGTGKWNGARASAYCGAPAGTDGCGIKLTALVEGDSPTAFLRLGGLTTDITVRGVEVDGNWPAVGRGWAGFKLDDVTYRSDDYPGMWRENVVFEQNYVHNTLREGLYIGPVCCGPGASASGANSGGIPLRDITIRHNLVTDTGWDGIQLKSAYAGSNQIYENWLRDVGRDPNSADGQFMGISCADTQYNVFRNLVINSGESSLQARVSDLREALGPLVINIFNNVSVNAGLANNEASHGINVIRASSRVARHRAAIYNNTVVRPRGDGIAVRGENVGSDTRVSSNIIAGAGNRAIVVPSGSSVTANGAGTPNAFGFVDASNHNFRLRSDSVARDAGALRLFADEDMNKIHRPQGQRADQGAFEYMKDPPPNPPVLR